MGHRQKKAKDPSERSPHRGSPGAPADANIRDEQGTDPRLRPFIVAMANAIIKDMLREQEEEPR